MVVMGIDLRADHWWILLYFYLFLFLFFVLFYFYLYIYSLFLAYFLALQAIT